MGDVAKLFIRFKHAQSPIGSFPVPAIMPRSEVRIRWHVLQLLPGRARHISAFAVGIAQIAKPSVLLHPRPVLQEGVLTQGRALEVKLAEPRRCHPRTLSAIADMTQSGMLPFRYTSCRMAWHPVSTPGR